MRRLLLMVFITFCSCSDSILDKSISKELTIEELNTVMQSDTLIEIYYPMVREVFDNDNITITEKAKYTSYTYSDIKFFFKDAIIVDDSFDSEKYLKEYNKEYSRINDRIDSILSDKNDLLVRIYNNSNDYEIKKVYLKEILDKNNIRNYKTESEFIRFKIDSLTKAVDPKLYNFFELLD